MRPLVLLIPLFLVGCNLAPPPPPLPPIAKVNFQPVKNRVAQVQQGNAAIGKDLQETREALDKAITDSTALTIDVDQLKTDLKATSDALARAEAEKKAQDDRITGLNIDLNAAQEDADAKNLAANQAVAERNEFSQDAANYKALLVKLHDHWGLGYFWEGTKYLGWHIIIVLVVLAGLSFLLNMFVPALQPLFAAIVKFFVGIPGRVVAFLKNLWPRKPPPPT